MKQLTKQQTMSAGIKAAAIGAAVWLAFVATPAVPQLPPPSTRIVIGSTPVQGGSNGQCLNITAGEVGAAACGTVTSIGTAGLATGGPITGSGTVTVTAATQADQETATSTTTAVTPGRQQFHPSAAKAWARCTNAAGTYTLAASYNISGDCGKTGTGALTLTFITAFSSTAFACVATMGTAGVGYISAGAASASTASVAMFNTSVVALDNTFSIACYGDQ